MGMAANHTKVYTDQIIKLFIMELKDRTFSCHNRNGSELLTLWSSLRDWKLTKYLHSKEEVSSSLNLLPPCKWKFINIQLLCKLIMF